MKNFLIRFIVASILLCFANNVIAQRTGIYTYPNAKLVSAKNLFEIQLYSAAQKQFDEVIKTTSPQTEECTEANYFAALCAYELFNADAATRLTKFIENYPESQRIKMAYYFMANLSYRNKLFKDALEWYEKINAGDLPSAEHDAFKFKKGYCYFIRKDFAKAKTYLNEVKDGSSTYANPANYYFSHIAYSEANYETALSGFKKFDASSPFYPTIPYYVAHIYYLQKKYPELIEYTASWIDSANVKRAPELARLLGDAYYRTGKYSEAIPYLNRYFEKGNKPEREDYFQLAFSYYKAKNYAKAIDNYKKAVGKSDSLSQVSYYQLGDCYLALQDKQLARNCYEAASKENFYPDIAEDALFTYAKLSYELAYNPYHEAVDAFEKYITTYPKSPKLDEAFKYMVNVYLTTKNYKDALASIEKISKRSIDMQYAYQKIAYFRGVELFNDRSYAEAIPLFDKAIANSKDKKITAASAYWKAESKFRTGKYLEAQNDYTEFMLTPGASLLKEFGYVNYNIGYTHFKLDAYDNATVAFRKFIAEKGQANKRMVNDAMIRIGDCYYMNKSYSEAIDYYSEAIQLNLFDTDYALFQKGGALGLNGKTEEKISQLKKLVNGFPKSDYVDDAKYEIGNSYFQQENYASAVQYFNEVRDEYPNSSYVKKSMLKTALAYYNMDKDAESIIIYKQIIEKYPSSQESRESVAGMRNIYVETGDIDSFEKYIKTQSGISFSNAAIDSTTYESAELRFMKGDCDHASNDFKNYLNKFANGIFSLNANYYLAECLVKSNPTEALPYYEAVVKKNKNKFTENALLKAASINYKNKNYAAALINYTQLELNAEVPANILEAQIGQMRCNYLENKFDQSIGNARKILGNEKVSNEIISEAHLTIGKSAESMPGNDSLALHEYILTSKLTQSEAGAEAHYRLAAFYHKSANYPECEKTIFDLIDRVPSYDFWIAKGFILLADNYHALADDFQAKETLKSIIDKCEIPEIIQEAQTKMNAINEAELKAASERKTEDVDIKMQDTNTKDDKLFEAPIVPENNHNE